MAKYRKLSRTSSQRKALLRGQVTQLLYHGRIVTTEAKAKEQADTAYDHQINTLDLSKLIEYNLNKISMKDLGPGK